LESKKKVEDFFLGNCRNKKEETAKRGVFCRVILIYHTKDIKIRTLGRHLSTGWGSAVTKKRKERRHHISGYKESYTNEEVDINH